MMIYAVVWALISAYSFWCASKATTNAAQAPTFITAGVFSGISGFFIFIGLLSLDKFCTIIGVKG